MNKFAELISDVGLLWTTYDSFYLKGIRNTLILAVVATVIGCIIGLIAVIVFLLYNRRYMMDILLKFKQMVTK